MGVTTKFVFSGSCGMCRGESCVAGVGRFAERLSSGVIFFVVYGGSVWVMLEKIPLENKT